MSVELECPAHCDLGVGGAKYRNPALEFDFAFQMLNMHRADCHGVHGAGGGGAAAEGEGGVQLVRPSISRGWSVELDCTARCDLGVDGTKYRTPPAPDFDVALQLLD